MLILRKNLSRPLSWDELDRNQELLEINEWLPQAYVANQNVVVVSGSTTTIYHCKQSHAADVYAPTNNFITHYGVTELWMPIGSTYNGYPSNTDIYVTGMTYNSTGFTGNTLSVHQTCGYPTVSVQLPSYALYDHYTSNVYLTGATLTLERTGSLADLNVDLQSLIDIATGVTHTDYYVTGASLNHSTYVLTLKRNDGVDVTVNLTSLRDGNYYTTGATLSGTTLTFTKNFGSSYSVNLSTLSSGTSGFSGYSGYSGVTGAPGGESGYSGYSGSGVSGYSGYSGSGISGYSGYSGTGASGYSGYSGLGVSGYSGYSGLGVSGYSGYSGTGTSGYSGYSGRSGYSGYSGRSGYSGYSGTQGLYGAASLILNGDGACTTDWLAPIDDPTYWIPYDMVSLTVITGSGFTNNACKIEADYDTDAPCGAQETSYQLIPGVEYSLTFQYISNVILDVTDGFTTYGSYAAVTGSTSGVTLTFTAVSDAYLVFGAGTGRTATYGDWWVIDKVTLRCGSCAGSGYSGYSGYAADLKTAIYTLTGDDFMNNLQSNVNLLKVEDKDHLIDVIDIVAKFHTGTTSYSGGSNIKIRHLGSTTDLLEIPIIYVTGNTDNLVSKFLTTASPLSPLGQGADLIAYAVQNFASTGPAEDGGTLDLFILYRNVYMVI